MITWEIHDCDTSTISSLWLRYVWMTEFWNFFKFPCIVRIHAWFFMHCRNHYSNSHTNDFMRHGLYNYPWWLCGNEANIFQHRKDRRLVVTLRLEWYNHLSMNPILYLQHNICIIKMKICDHTVFTLSHVLMTSVDNTAWWYSIYPPKAKENAFFWFYLA